MYLSYRLARSARLRSYMLDLALFVVAASLLSVCFPAIELFWLFLSFVFPLVFLSFLFLSWPTYSWYLELPAPEWLRHHGFSWVWYRGVSFLTVDVFSTPDWEFRDGSLVSSIPWSLEQYFAAFSFFLFVNMLGVLLGASLGYWMRKKHRTQDFDGNKWWIVAVGVVCVVVSFIIGSALGERGRMALFGLGIVLLEIVLLSPLVVRFVRMRVATLTVLCGIILSLAGGLINQNLMIAMGRILIFFGVVIYIAEFAITYTRTHKTAT